MLSMEDALTAREFHLDGCTRIYGPRGGVKENVVRYRRNGRTQTWKTRPHDFRVPVVHGLKGYTQLYQHDAIIMHTAAACPLNTVCCSCAIDQKRAFACFCKCHTS